MSVAQLRVSLGRYELSDEGDVVETGRDEEEVVVPLAHTEGGLTASVQRGAKAAAESGGVPNVRARRQNHQSVLLRLQVGGRGAGLGTGPSGVVFC